MYTLPAIGGLAMLSGGLFFLAFNRGQKDFRTILYLFLMLLWSLLLGLLVWYFDKIGLMDLQDSFIFLQIMMALTGIFHVWWMYEKLFWAKRNPHLREDDSLLAELFFSLTTAAASIGIIMAALRFSGRVELSGILWPIGIWLVLPFLLVKSWDFLNQIPRRDYRIKWQFQKKRLNENDWEWLNEMWLNFETRESWVRPGMNRKAKFRILAPRGKELGEVFRLAVRVYNQQGNEIMVQDLGFEPENSGRFWWLFSLKFVWNRPHTWLPNNRFINPFEPSFQNALRPHDIVLARRVAFDFQNNGFEDGEVAMGTL